MKILFTGASSFSGMWFVKELVEAGHEVTAIFKNPLESYQGVRKERIEKILPLCRPFFNIAFGDEAFLNLIRKNPSIDLFCHHAADVTNYRSLDFDIYHALESNTKNLSSVLMALKNAGCQKVLLTGSVFEQNEGKGSDNLRAVSPYGLSKGLTTDFFSYHVAMQQMILGKFVIPNPFGAYEEGRFTSYLAKSWLQNKIPAVNTPLYIRDNIPVTLLAKAYKNFAENLISSSKFIKYNPSGYIESQGDFTKRFAQEMNKRINLSCQYELADQQEFNEPLIRTNLTPLNWQSLNWDESQFWDQLVDYYVSSNFQIK